jgi:hypothetical protein
MLHIVSRVGFHGSSRTPMRPRHLVVVFAQASEGLVRRLLPPCVFPARQLSVSMLMAVLVNQDVLAALSKHDGTFAVHCLIHVY